jgi:hypothetical protein
LELVFLFLGFPLWLRFGAAQILLFFSIGLFRGLLPLLLLIVDAT